MTIDIYRLAGRSYLLNKFISCADQINLCCGLCWSCKKNKSIIAEIEKKGFTSFNSGVKCWKIFDHPDSKFEIQPCKDEE